jgi:hypothetical protein
VAKKQQGQVGPHGHEGHGGSGDDGGGGDGYGGDDQPREPYDDPGEHLEIERRRFLGSLPPTPERYALAREQWYRLPGAVVRPPMDPPVDMPPPAEAPPKSA